MKITKMHGLGNDFIVVEEGDVYGLDVNDFAERVCTRRLGVGADGLLVVCPSTCADVKMRIINADGSEAEMCGNGIRCFAKYVYEKGIVKKTAMTIETAAGVMKPDLKVENGVVTDITVDMGAPTFERDAIPMFGTGSALDVTIHAGGRTFEISSLLMGVPHTVVFSPMAGMTDIMKHGPLIERHEFFPRKTNVNFVELLNHDNIRVTTWERGAGLTLACGTGSCACVVACCLKGYTGRRVNVHLRAGQLLIEYLEDGRVLMTGPAAYVFTGELV